MTADNTEDSRKVDVKDLFKDVKYYLVGNIKDEVITLLNSRGAKQDNYLSQMVSHVICDSTEDDDDYTEAAEAKELFDLPVVTSQWVLLSSACNKQLPIDVFSPDGKVFAGLVICPEHLEEDDRTNIWAMVTVNGGVCQTTLNKDCTHLITTKEEGEKYEAALLQEDLIKIVTPDWVTDSLKAGSKVDEAVYHPSLIEIPKPPSPPKPPKPPTPEPQPQTAIRQRFSPATSLPFHFPSLPGFQQARPGLPMHGMPHPNMPRPPTGAGMPPHPHHFPPTGYPYPSPLEAAGPGQPRSRTPPLSRTPPASRTPPTSRTPPASRTPPGNRMPHQSRTPPNMPTYPIGFPNLPIPGYVPDSMRTDIPTAKEALARMVNNRLQAGGRSLDRPDNQQTPPTAPPMPIPSPDAASRTLRNITNNMEVATEKVPPDMCLLGCVFFIWDYHTIAGSSEITCWKKVIEQHGGEVEATYSQKVTHFLCPHQQSDLFQQALKDQKRVVTAYWLNDCLLQKKMQPPWQAVHLPLIYGDQKPCQKQIICMTNFEGDERLRVKQMITAMGAKYTGYMTHANSALVCKKLEGRKYEKAREWQTPVVNVTWLSDILMGNLDALRLPVNQKYLQFGQSDDFQVNLKIVAHLMVGWETPMKISKEVWKKFVPGTPKGGNEENQLKRKADEDLEGDAKKQKLEEEIHPSGFATYGPRVMFTGYGGKLLKRLKEVVERLGGIVVDDIKDGTHLVARSLTRTLKLFVGVNVCRCIVTKEWLEDSDQENKFVDEGKYALKDRQGETSNNCDLAESMRRSRKLPLFRGLSFYMTPSVLPSRKELGIIIESARGIVLKKRPTIRSLQATRSDKLAHHGYSSYVIISCDTDSHLCRDLKAKKIAVHNAEFILTGVLRQEVDFEIYRMPGFNFESKKSKAAQDMGD